MTERSVGSRCASLPRAGVMIVIRGRSERVVAVESGCSVIANKSFPERRLRTGNRLSRQVSPSMLPRALGIHRMRTRILPFVAALLKYCSLLHGFLARQRKPGLLCGAA